MYRQKKESWCVYDCVMLSYFRQRALTDALSHVNTLQSHGLDWTLCIRRNAKCPFFDFWNIKASYLELCLTKALPIYCNVMLMLINKYNSLSVKDLFWILVPSMSIWCDVKCTRLVKTPSGFRIVLRVRFWNWENSSFVSYFCFSVVSICLCAFYPSCCRLIACFNLFFLVLLYSWDYLKCTFKMRVRLLFVVFKHQKSFDRPDLGRSTEFGTLGFIRFVESFCGVAFNWNSFTAIKH